MGEFVRLMCTGMVDESMDRRVRSSSFNYLKPLCLCHSLLPNRRSLPNEVFNLVSAYQWRFVDRVLALVLGAGLLALLGTGC